MSESEYTEDSFTEVPPHINPQIFQLDDTLEEDSPKEHSDEKDQFIALFIPPNGEPWELNCTPERWNSLCRELVLGPAAPDSGDNFADPSQFTEFLEFRSCSRDWLRSPFNLPPLIMAMDGSGCKHGRRNDQATALATGLRVLKSGEKITISGPVVVCGSGQNGVGEDDVSQHEDILTGQPVAATAPDEPKDEFQSFTKRNFDTIYTAWKLQLANSQ
jgi:hypothetical protein